jgi:hypothetical protein
MQKNNQNYINLMYLCYDYIYYVYVHSHYSVFYTTQANKQTSFIIQSLFTEKKIESNRS